MLRIFLSTLLMAVMAVSYANPELADKHVKLSQNGCATCHQETPPSQEPVEAVCTGCHGNLQTLGNKPLPKGAVNPHLNHVDELYCNDCHHIHKASDNYCKQCHDDAFLGMQVP